MKLKDRVSILESQIKVLGDQITPKEEIVGISRQLLRPLGDITQDLEPLILEMADGHKLQHGEILNLIRGYLEIHCPDAKEVYEDGSEAEFYYGPRRGGE